MWLTRNLICVAATSHPRRLFPSLRSYDQWAPCGLRHACLEGLWMGHFLLTVGKSGKTLFHPFRLRWVPLRTVGFCCIWTLKVQNWSCIKLRTLRPLENRPPLPISKTGSFSQIQVLSDPFLTENRRNFDFFSDALKVNPLPLKTLILFFPIISTAH